MNPTSALIAGSSGLVGQELLVRLLSDPRYDVVHSLVRRPSAQGHPKLREHVVDFNALGEVPPIRDVFISLGTTMKKAGSKDAFRKVDFDYVLAVAQAAHRAGATRIGLVSSLGASASSSVFYSKVKGEAEDAILALGYEHVVLARPSVLDGDRTESRPMERIGLAALRTLSFMVPARLRAVHVRLVAEALLEAVWNATESVRILPSDEIVRRS